MAKNNIFAVSLMSSFEKTATFYRAGSMTSRSYVLKDWQYQVIAEYATKAKEDNPRKTWLRPTTMYFGWQVSFLYRPLRENSNV